MQFGGHRALVCELAHFSRRWPPCLRRLTCYDVGEEAPQVVGTRADPSSFLDLLLHSLHHRAQILLVGAVEVLDVEAVQEVSSRSTILVGILSAVLSFFLLLGASLDLYLVGLLGCLRLVPVPEVALFDLLALGMGELGDCVGGLDVRLHCRVQLRGTASPHHVDRPSTCVLLVPSR